MNTSSKLSKKDPSVELMRIIGAIMVVGTHVKLAPVINNHLSKTSVSLSCLVGDGVSLFWLILGFYLFNNTDYFTHIKKTTRRVVIPMACYSLFLFYFRDFIISPSSSVITHHSLADYKNLTVGGFLKLRNTVSDCGQFWYLYAYIVIILFFPALLGIVQYKAESKHRDAILLGIMGALLLINDLTLNEFMGFSHAPFQGAFAAAFIIIFGHIFYRHKDLFMNRGLAALISILAFGVVYDIRYNIQYSLYKSDEPSTHPLYWYTLFSVASITCIAVFAFSINKPLRKRIPCTIINHIGRLTMGIYFVHPLVISLLNKRNIPQRLREHYQSTSGGIIMYQIIMTCAVFAISFVMAEVFSLIKYLLIRLIKQFRNKQTHTASSEE